MGKQVKPDQEPHVRTHHIHAAGEIHERHRKSTGTFLSRLWLTRHAGQVEHRLPVQLAWCKQVVPVTCGERRPSLVETIYCRLYVQRRILISTALPWWWNVFVWLYTEVDRLLARKRFNYLTNGTTAQWRTWIALRKLVQWSAQKAERLLCYWGNCFDMSN